MSLDLFKPPDIQRDHAMEAHDAGWRKYFLVLISMVLLVWGFWWTGVADVAKEVLERRSISYTTFAEFLLGIVGLYFSANVGYKVMAGRTNSQTMVDLAKNKTPEPRGPEGSGKAKLED